MKLSVTFVLLFSLLSTVTPSQALSVHKPQHWPPSQFSAHVLHQLKGQPKPERFLQQQPFRETVQPFSHQSDVTTPADTGIWFEQIHLAPEIK